MDMKNSVCWKAAIGRMAAYKVAPVVSRYAFLSAVILFLVVAQSAFCDEHGKSKNEHDDDRSIVNPHDGSGAAASCSACHTAKPPALSFDAVTTCVKCHSGNIDSHPVSRHPIGTVPKIRVPSFLPLTADGRMVCNTCHDPHNKLTQGRENLLRVDYQTLCASCHVGY